MPRRRLPSDRTVRMMPFPVLDKEFWRDIPDENDPRAVAIALRAFKWLVREVDVSLSPFEHSFILLLLDRTTGSARATFTTTHHQLARLMLSRSAGVRRTEKQLRRCIKSLTTIGLVAVHEENKASVELSVNHHWTYEYMIRIIERKPRIRRISPGRRSGRMLYNGTMIVFVQSPRCRKTKKRLAANMRNMIKSL